LSRWNTISAVILLVFSFCVGLKASTFPLGDLKRVGPGFFPIVLSSLMGLLSLLFLITSCMKRADQGRIHWPKQWFGIGAVLFSLFAYGFLLKILGFSLTTFLFSLGLLKYGYPGKWVIPFGGAVATTFFTLLIFRYWLGTPFPTGWIGY